MNCFIVDEKPINLIGTKAALNDEMNVFDTQVVSTKQIYVCKFVLVVVETLA